MCGSKSQTTDPWTERDAFRAGLEIGLHSANAVWLQAIAEMRHWSMVPGEASRKITDLLIALRSRVDAKEEKNV